MGIRVMMVGGDAYQNAMRFNYIHESLNVIVVALCWAYTRLMVV